MKLLIIGGSGFLGGELIRQAVAAEREGREVVATYATRPGDAPADRWYRLDLREAGQPYGVDGVGGVDRVGGVDGVGGVDAVDRLIADLAPCTVVNASSGHADWAVTADGAIRVAAAAARHGCRLLHVSTDAVFSGDRPDYDERCLPDPITPYGAAKAAAETAVRLLVPDSVIARTSLIIGDGGSVHERHVHDLATGRRTGVLFTDVVRCPVHVTDLAAALLELADSRATGIHHLAGPDAVTRHELGVLIAHRDGLDPTRLLPGHHADSPRPGPLTLRLNSTATQSRLGTRLRGAREFLTTAPRLTAP
ncbi:sugar nucleotide-binding protein [Streptomyces griseosporeus]|uniref:sugar nucleotide-binding protein n=1 Tax=Streptomyces griseosporeus TaxID=1910 RepID=UPI00167D896C|nr:sugar nucleotide-binding protein [Streptomyces griseosporeus]GHF74294.1 dTDP-4-dehydrorhamnose reductase [Streptomyces griseosporeus]